ncbi:hypothetical protein Cfla_2381 [Cellulomonas flavigena DSM 20109]|uniref:Uncharacterized protein n=1 Tax=Cellulomonas flavigena (strain ATCC 482 / DSM 20109 / BCRC 11376 / JCM 18109 / NBRC 3775 / NCIMB 8073 / NRS 134) TaxID=446466 RepID=D5UHF0_CELFN|nr:hypothetical protein [Cellulomonas flavigena]ADG75271.1 hypothetical protein Cfla_2381 [Cellulomonas flavigena DSM 20109]
MRATPSPSAGRAGRRSVPARRAVACAASLALVLLAAACTTGPREGAAPTTASATASTPGPTSTATATTPAPQASAQPPTPEPTPEPAPAPGAEPPDGRGAVPVVVTYSGWDVAASRVAVGAYVEGLVESGGTCTLTLTGPGTTRTASQPATPDAGSTSCGELAAGASSGTWSARVTYESPTASGASATVEVVVP